MATAPKMTPGRNQQPTFNKDQLRKDRLVGILVLFAIAVLMAFLIWLASLGGIPADVDYWPMMP